MFTATVNEAFSRLGLDLRGTAPFPRSTAPMLVHKASRLVSSPEWTYEPKWDGFRVIAAARDGSVRLLSRNGHSFTRLFGPVSDALRGFPASLVLDGEVVAITDEGRPDFEALQQRLRPRRLWEIVSAELTGMRVLNSASWRTPGGHGRSPRLWDGTDLESGQPRPTQTITPPPRRRVPRVHAKRMPPRGGS